MAVFLGGEAAVADAVFAVVVAAVAAFAGPGSVIADEALLKRQSDREACVVVERKAVEVGRNLVQEADTNLGEVH